MNLDGRQPGLARAALWLGIIAGYAYVGYAFNYMLLVSQGFYGY
jgi:hypothetical protein